VAWHAVVGSAAWHNWGGVKRMYSTASILGDCTIFNVGGNKDRLVTRIRYATQIVYVLKVMTHREYDEEKWVAECGCLVPPPVPPAARRKPDRSKRGAEAVSRPKRKG